MPQIYNSNSNSNSNNSDDSDNELHRKVNGKSAKRVSQNKKSLNINKDQTKKTANQPSNNNQNSNPQKSESNYNQKDSQKKRSPDDYSDILRKEKPTKNPFKVFAPKPVNVFFASQLRKEEIVMLLRQHPITQIKKIVITLLLSLMPVVFSSAGIIDFLPSNYQFAFYLGWFLIVISYGMESFLTWFFHVYIITDERIIDVDFDSLFYKNITSAKLDNIEDITLATAGFLGSTVDYGPILIQTAGETNQIMFEAVPHPAKVTALLNEMLLEEEREKIEGRVR